MMWNIQFQLRLRDDSWSRYQKEEEYIIDYSNQQQIEAELSLFQLVKMKDLKIRFQGYEKKWSLLDVRTWQLATTLPLMPIIPVHPLETFKASYPERERSLERPLTVPTVPSMAQQSWPPLLISFVHDVNPLPCHHQRKDQQMIARGRATLWSGFRDWPQHGPEETSHLIRIASPITWEQSNREMLSNIELPRVAAEQQAPPLTGVRARLLGSIEQQQEKIGHQPKDVIKPLLSGLALVTQWHPYPPFAREPMAITPPTEEEQTVIPFQFPGEKLDLPAHHGRAAAITRLQEIRHTEMQRLHLTAKRSDGTALPHEGEPTIDRSHRAGYLVTAEMARATSHQFLAALRPFPTQKEEKLPTVTPTFSTSLLQGEKSCFVVQIEEALLWLCPRKIYRAKSIGPKPSLCRAFVDGMEWRWINHPAMVSAVTVLEYQPPPRYIPMPASACHADEEERTMILIRDAMCDASDLQHNAHPMRCAHLTSHEKQFPAPLQHLLRYCRLSNQFPSLLPAHQIRGQYGQREAMMVPRDQMLGLSFDMASSLDEYLMLDGIVPFQADQWATHNAASPPPTALTPTGCPHQGHAMAFLPFERTLATELFDRVMALESVLLVMDAMLPFTGIGVLVILACLRSPGGFKNIAWVQPEEEISYAKMLLDKCAASQRPATRLQVDFLGWTDLIRRSPSAAEKKKMGPYDLIMASRFVYGEHCHRLAQLATRRWIAVGAWPTSTSSELYLTGERLGIRRVIVRKTEDREIQPVWQRLRTIPHGILAFPQVRTVIEAGTRRVAELAAILETEQLVPPGWLAGLPGQWEFHLMLSGLRDLDASHPLLPLIQELYVTVGTIDRLLHRGIVEAWEFVEEAKFGCGLEGTIFEALSPMFFEIEAGITEDYPKLLIQRMAHQRQEPGGAATLVIVECDLERLLLADRSINDLDVVLQTMPVTLEMLVRLASTQAALIVIEPKNLPSFAELFASSQLEVWPFHQVIDFTFRWPGSSFLMQQILHDPIHSQASYQKVRFSLREIPPADQWIHHFQTGCPGGLISEIEFLDYEIIFAQPLPKYHQRASPWPRISTTSSDTRSDSAENNQGQAAPAKRSHLQDKALTSTTPLPVTKKPTDRKRTKHPMTTTTPPSKQQRLVTPTTHRGKQSVGGIMAQWQQLSQQQGVNHLGFPKKTRTYAHLDQNSYIDPKNGKIKSNFFS